MTIYLDILGISPPQLNKNIILFNYIRATSFPFRVKCHCKPHLLGPFLALGGAVYFVNKDVRCYYVIGHDLQKAGFYETWLTRANSN